MKTAFFFSGFDPASGFPAPIAQALRESIPRRDILLFIASTPDNHPKNETYMRGAIAWFDWAGIPFGQCRLLDDRIPPTLARHWIHAADVIYLMGGDTLAQFAFLRDSQLIDTLRDTHAVVMGLSAGAINMGKNALCTRDDHNPETVCYEGLGIADITVDPHFDPSDTARIAELAAPAWPHPIYAMCDDSAIIARDGGVTFLGEIYRIDGDGKLSRM